MTEPTPRQFWNHLILKLPSDIFFFKLHFHPKFSVVPSFSDDLHFPVRDILFMISCSWYPVRDILICWFVASSCSDIWGFMHHGSFIFISCCRDSCLTRLLGMKWRPNVTTDQHRTCLASVKRAISVTAKRFSGQNQHVSTPLAFSHAFLPVLTPFVWINCYSTMVILHTSFWV